MTLPGDAPAPVRILVVDDDPDIREVLQMVLEMALSDRPHEIVTAEHGREALEILGTYRPCLVLLDLMMPVMSGSELLSAMRKDARLVDVPVVILSAWHQEFPTIEGAQGFLAKPADVERLMEVIERYCFVV